MTYIDRELVEREMKYWRIPGAALAVVGDGIEEEFECFGFRDRENGLPFDEDTLFCIASCSKAMTSALIARLVAEGTLDYDKPVNSYIPEVQPPRFRRTEHQYAIAGIRDTFHGRKIIGWLRISASHHAI